MIVLTNIYPKKREHWCFISNSKVIRFKGKIWKILKYRRDVFLLKDDDITFALKIKFNSFRIEMNEARGYNNEYIKSFCSSILDSLAKRSKICKTCIHKFKYQISRECNDKYKKSMIVNKPEE
jgi:hypothetical protein